jgi:murein DD-endopeptidase MepM/ murein hydrolase activator NlpD
VLSAAWRATTRIALGAAIMVGVLFVSLDAITTHSAAPVAQATVLKVPAGDKTWTLDLDGDGVADLANPTHGVIRGADAYGSGKFGARRDNGKRKHEGADFVVAPGGAVWSPLNGVVTAIGYAYHGDVSLRYVEVKDLVRNLSARVFYIEPSVKVGQKLLAGDALGAADSLTSHYPEGMTNHVHVEIRDRRGVPLDPASILPTGAVRFQLAAFAQTTKPPTSTVSTSSVRRRG